MIHVTMVPDIINKYLALGWHLLPIRPRTKQPMDGQGLKHATLDLEKIKTWHSKGCDWAIACQVSGVITLDVDPRHGGKATWDELCEELGDLPEHPVQSTRGDGWHHIFKDPGCDSVGQMGDGVDVKRRGYVLVVPSPGYSWDSEPGKDIPPLPGKWVEALRKNKPRGTVSPRTNSGETTRYGQVALERECEQLANTPDGDRNNALNTAALKIGALAAGGEIDPHDGKSALLAVAGAIGLRESESVPTIRSGWTTGEASPRAAPTMPGRLPATTAAATWAGNQAAQVDRVDEIKALVDEEDLAVAFQVGATTFIESGGRVTKPQDVCDTDARRFKRVLGAAPKKRKPPLELPITIKELVRHPVAGRATFDMTIKSDTREATLYRLDGAALGSYKAIRDIAIESCISLPSVNMRSKEAWDALLALAFTNVKEVVPDIEESQILAVKQEIISIIMDSELAESELDIKRGMVLDDEATGAYSILPRSLVAKVRARMQDDRPTREHIVDAGRMLKVKNTRPLMEDGKRPRVWSFPKALITGDDK